MPTGAATAKAVQVVRMGPSAAVRRRSTRPRATTPRRRSPLARKPLGTRLHLGRKRRGIPLRPGRKPRATPLRPGRKRLGTPLRLGRRHRGIPRRLGRSARATVRHLARNARATHHPRGRSRRVTKHRGGKRRATAPRVRNARATVLRRARSGRATRHRRAVNLRRSGLTMAGNVAIGSARSSAPETSATPVGAGHARDGSLGGRSRCGGRGHGPLPQEVTQSGAWPPPTGNHSAGGIAPSCAAWLTMPGCAATRRRSARGARVTARCAPR